jgi:vacuolar-type H+-ATPase subunit C/Vma6
MRSLRSAILLVCSTRVVCVVFLLPILVARDTPTFTRLCLRVPTLPYLFWLKSADHESDSRNVLEEVEIETLDSSLIKYWLGDFSNDVDKFGGDNSTIMDDIFKVRADTNTINITLNSFDSPLNDPAIRMTVSTPPLATWTRPEQLSFSMLLTSRNLAGCWNSSRRTLRA